MWSKVKQNLRSAGARAPEELLTAIGDALHAVTADDCRGLFMATDIPLHNKGKCSTVNCPAPSGGIIRITEYMYQGAGGEFIEFTNLDLTPIDMAGWSYDDDSATPGVVDLSAFGIVNPGQSVILAEAPTATFITNWNLMGVTVIGNLTTNLSRNDEINLFDAGGALVDRLTYGDQSFPGTIRTQNISGWPCEDAVGQKTFSIGIWLRWPISGTPTPPPAETSATPERT